MASELYVQIPASYGDFWSAPPGSAMSALLDYGSATGHLLNLHLQMVLYSHRQRTDGYISRGAARSFCRPASPRTADRDAGRLVQAGLIHLVDNGRGFFVPAAKEWPVVRIGKRDQIPTFIRELVYERDGYRCVECGSSNDLTLDHIVPWSRNGPDTASNLRTLCGPCNSSKGARVLWPESAPSSLSFSLLRPSRRCRCLLA